MNSILASVEWNLIGDKIWNRLTSRTALFIYAGIILVLIIAIIIRVIVGEYNRVSIMKNSLEGKEKGERQEILETARKTIEEELEPLKDLALPSVVVQGGNGTKGAVSANSSPAEEEGGSRFYMLTEIDKEYERYRAPEYDNELSLREICEEFRNY